MTKSHKKKSGGENETPGSHKHNKGDPPHENARSELHPEDELETTETPVKQVITGEEVMDYLKRVGEEVGAISKRLEKAEKRSLRSRRDAKKGSFIPRKEDSKGPSKKLLDDFDDVETDQSDPDFHEDLVSEEEENSQRKEHSERREESKAKPASSEASSMQLCTNN